MKPAVTSRTPELKQKTETWTRHREKSPERNQPRPPGSPRARPGSLPCPQLRPQPWERRPFPDGGKCFPARSPSYRSRAKTPEPSHPESSYLPCPPSKPVPQTPPAQIVG